MEAGWWEKLQEEQRQKELMKEHAKLVAEETNRLAEERELYRRLESKPAVLFTGPFSKFVGKAFNQFLKGLAFTLFGLFGLILLAQITAITGGDTKPIMGMIEKILYGLFRMFFGLLEVIAEIARYVVDFVFGGLV